MKKLLLVAIIALTNLCAHAQTTLTLSTYSGTDLAKYAGKTLNISANRYLFTGWNTISLPFSMTEEQINETFGSDCKLEKLAGVEHDGHDIKLNFQDCKSEGIQANIPYILYYTGKTGDKKISVKNATISNTHTPLSFAVQGTSLSVTMSGTQQIRKAQGVYGIMGKDNAEALFVNVDDVETGFYATRCYIELSNGNSFTLTTNHIGKDVTSIQSTVKPNENVDVYNISGIKVASQIGISEISKLQQGIYVIKGKKILVE
ncbi:MAG: hypothetical protein II278_06675 [Bacteroidaceae bacterium]|nr:hypothetical protein [Bacteroidaceae bacterium]